MSAAQQWKCGNEFAPYHPSASHVEPGHRDGWNACYRASQAEIERLRSELLAAREDARRWQAFLRFTVGQADADLGPDIDITYTPSGYNGSQWATIELCWRHPQWTAATAEHANAAIDSAMKGDAS